MKVQLSCLKASQTLVYFMLPSSLSDQAESETSHEILSLVDFNPFLLCLFYSHTSFFWEYILYKSLALESLFWSLPLGNQCRTRYVLCVHLLGQHKTFLNVVYDIRHWIKKPLIYIHPFALQQSKLRPREIKWSTQDYPPFND